MTKPREGDSETEKEGRLSSPHHKKREGAAHVQTIRVQHTHTRERETHTHTRTHTNTSPAQEGERGGTPNQSHHVMSAQAENLFPTSGQDDSNIHNVLHMEDQGRLHMSELQTQTPPPRQEHTGVAPHSKRRRHRCRHGHSQWRADGPPLPGPLLVMTGTPHPRPSPPHRHWRCCHWRWSPLVRAKTARIPGHTHIYIFMRMFVSMHEPAHKHVDPLHHTQLTLQEKEKKKLHHPTAETDTETKAHDSDRDS